MRPLEITLVVVVGGRVSDNLKTEKKAAHYQRACDFSDSLDILSL